MRVGFDTSVLRSGHSTRGVGYYTSHLLNGLKSLKDLDIVEVEGEVPSNIDLIHYPFFDLFYHTLPMFKKKPTVVTIHDITPLLFSGHYPPGIKGLMNLSLQKLALQSVRAVITVSNASKADIVKHFHMDPKKVFVTYEAPSKEYRIVDNRSQLEKIKDKFKLPDKFAIYIGNVNWNKNINNLTQACLDADLDMVIIGKAFKQTEDLNHHEMKSYKDFLKSFESNERVHCLGFVETEDLVSIMNVAELMLFPSYYEGFGLPVLEAQSCGLPVITSNNSSLPEVAGGGAILIDPYMPEEITSAINSLMKDKVLRQKLIKAGLENVKRFDWDKTAQETVKVYEYATKN